jgi:CspA family cold shock protein
MSATVKWFNPEKGFGFVALDDGTGDAFLHVAVLERSGHSAVQPGATLQVRVGQGQKGPQVTEVLEVDESTATPQAARRPGPGGPRAGGPRMPLGDAVQMSGTMKWYNPDKGFGFAVVEGGGKDEFVHASVLQRAGLQTLAEGQRVTMDVAEGRKGPEAVAIRLAD